MGLFELEPVGRTKFSGNIVGINGDGAFRAIIPEINRNDDYQVMFHGCFGAKQMVLTSLVPIMRMIVVLSG